MTKQTWFVTAALIGLVFGASAHAQQCPPEGDARQDLARTLNVSKNRETAPTSDKINANATLPAVLAAGPDLDRWSRDDGATFEGTVIDVKVGGIETANCHAKDPADRDTHIELALDSDAVETQRVIVEVTPRWRAKMQAQGVDWSTSALQSSLTGQHVRVTGWMLDDLEHVPEAENTNPHGPKNWRATVWEIHPITDIQIIPAPQAASMALTTMAAVRPAFVQVHGRSKTPNVKCLAGSRWSAKQNACIWRRPRAPLEDR